ncbi:MAG: hypothetical protein LBH32_08285 [Dysgonamonadaceae bacterium]|nr:hypothetical protein [Dysgonamonadaceae bacterium]
MKLVFTDFRPLQKKSSNGNIQKQIADTLDFCGKTEKDRSGNVRFCLSA